LAEFLIWARVGICYARVGDGGWRLLFSGHLVLSVEKCRS